MHINFAYSTSSIVVNYAVGTVLNMPALSKINHAAAAAARHAVRETVCLSLPVNMLTKL